MVICDDFMAKLIAGIYCLIEIRYLVYYSIFVTINNVMFYES
jgi:hypothetical protein